MQPLPPAQHSMLLHINPLHCRLQRSVQYQVTRVLATHTLIKEPDTVTMLLGARRGFRPAGSILQSWRTASNIGDSGTTFRSLHDALTEKGPASSPVQRHQPSPSGWMKGEPSFAELCARARKVFFAMPVRRAFILLAGHVHASRFMTSVGHASVSIQINDFDLRPELFAALSNLWPRVWGVKSTISADLLTASLSAFCTLYHEASRSARRFGSLPFPHFPSSCSDASPVSCQLPGMCMSATAGVSMFEEAQLAKLHTGTGVHSTHSATASSGHSSQSLANQQLLHADFQQQEREKIMAAHTVQDTFAGDLSCPVQQGNALSTGPMALYQAGRESGHYRSDPRQRLTVSMLQVRHQR